MLASSPSRKSSTTTVEPAFPKAPPSSISASASRAASRVSATTTPFPAASPSALRTTGSGWAST